VCEYGPWEDGFVHRGFGWAANWLIGNVLPDIVKRAQERQVFTIVSTGHSLGGAVASIFAITMHSFINSLQEGHPLYGINIQCHAYGPPPTVSENLAGNYEEIVFNYIHDEDIVPTLCYGGLLDTRSMVLMTLDQHEGNTQRLKQIVGTSSWVPKFVKNAVSANAEKPLEVAGLTEEARARHPKLHQPGKFFHMRSAQPSGEKKAPKSYITEAGDLSQFAEIHITDRMILDHLPDNYDEAIRSLHEKSLLE